MELTVQTIIYAYNIQVEVVCNCDTCKCTVWHDVIHLTSISWYQVEWIEIREVVARMNLYCLQ